MALREQVLPDEWLAGSIILNRRRLSDAPEVLAAIEASITELAAFLRWAAKGVPSRGEFERSVVKRNVDFDSGTGFEYVLRELSTRQVIGEAGGELSADGDAVEIGYWVRSDMTGRGYATAAARGLTSLAFVAFARIERVEIRMDDGNTASKAIARRLGFSRVGGETFQDEPLRGQSGAGHVYAVTRDEWVTLTAAHD